LYSGKVSKHKIKIVDYFVSIVDEIQLFVDTKEKMLITMMDSVDK
jgi:hypothetical protein